MSGITEAEKPRAGRNRTVWLNDSDISRLSDRLIHGLPSVNLQVPPQGTIWGDCSEWFRYLPNGFVDLLVLDPPYNLDKDFNGRRFAKMPVEDYALWLNDVIVRLKPLLKATATVYICSDWLTSHSVYDVAQRHFEIRNRITWEREKGRGAQRNWKNASEDIWFCTMSSDYVFNVEAVKLRRKVIAPYTDSNGDPKDWQRTESGNYRDTHPSNLWTDVTIPFWSMPENTDHPAQKSEKLIAKLVLASTNPGDMVFDPFLGSGTSSVVAKKLGRRYLGIEIDQEYCLLAERRLEMANLCADIQGFVHGVFWERNSLQVCRKGTLLQAESLFEECAFNDPRKTG